MADRARPRVPWFALTSTGVVVLAGLWLLRTSPQAEIEREQETRTGATAAADVPVPPTIRVDAIVVEERPQRSHVDISAELAAVRSVVIGAEVAGKVLEVTVSEHAHVAAGDLLVRLDSALLDAAVAQARAALLRAEASLSLASSERGRQRELAGEGVASTSELDRAESEASIGEAQVAEARARLQDAQTRLAKTRISAPFAGIVSQLDLEPGAYLQPGSRVAELVDLSEIEIEVGVGDRQVLALEADDAVRVAVDVYPGEWFSGRIKSVAPVPDPQTRNYAVPIRVPNPDERLRPGLLGTVRFTLGDERPALRIPRRAVQREFELDYLYVLERDGGADGVAKARRRRVSTEPVPFQPDLLQVSTGLASGERIAVSGVRELRDGLPVRFDEQASQP